MREGGSFLNGGVGTLFLPSTPYSFVCGVECPDDEVLAGASALISSGGDHGPRYICRRAVRTQARRYAVDIVSLIRIAPMKKCRGEPYATHSND